MPVDTTPPNTRYEVKNLGVLSSNPNENTLNLDDFLFGCCHETGYYGASIGSTITIKDGTYNKTWVIVGFDCEHYKLVIKKKTILIFTKNPVDFKVYWIVFFSH